MKRLITILLILLGCLLLVATAASANDEGWRLRFNGFYMDPGGELTVSTGPGPIVSTNSDTGSGAAINAEYRFSRRMGVELGLLGGAEAGVSVVRAAPSYYVVSDSVSMSAFCAGINFHLTPDRRLDLYAGPVVAAVNYSNLNVGAVRPPAPFPTRVEIVMDSDLGLGANLGVDVPFGDSRWLFNADVRYLETTMEGNVAGIGRRSVDYDPLMVGVGFGYSF